MTKKELLKVIHKHFLSSTEIELELRDSFVFFALTGSDYRQICYIEIKYLNNIEKENIYKAIQKLITGFDFSYYVSFWSIEEIEEFLR